MNNHGAETTNAATAGSATEPGAGFGRQDLVRSINDYIQKARHASLGVLGGVVFLFIAISMLRSIEGTFNDIWGVTRGRTWAAQITQFSAFLFWGRYCWAPRWGWRPDGTSIYPAACSIFRRDQSPCSSKFCRSWCCAWAFGIFYMLIPNTRVHWQAAVIGGLVGGVLWHLNNYFSVLYVSRWMIEQQDLRQRWRSFPVFMVGLYFSWLIVLFGAQVAYAFQNRAAYLQEKQTENINQRGREFVALRLMECVGQRFNAASAPATVPGTGRCPGGAHAPGPANHADPAGRPGAIGGGGRGPGDRVCARAPAGKHHLPRHPARLAGRAGPRIGARATNPPAPRCYGEFERILDAGNAARPPAMLTGPANW